MKAFIRSKLGRRFVRMFLILVLPVAALVWFGMRSASTTLEKETHATLRAASDGAEAQLREFLLCLKRTTMGLATDPAVRQAANGGGPGNGWVDVVARLRQRIPEAREVFCLDSKGRVVAASTPALAGRDFSQSDCFTLGREGFYSGDVMRDAVDGQLRWRMSAPVEESAETAGVIVLDVDPAVLTALATGKRVLDEGADTQSFRIGNTGETYIVDREGYLLTQSRFASNGVLRVKVETEPVQTWKDRDVEMIGDYNDYRNVPVSGASAILKEPPWLLVTEIDFSQALAPVARWRNVLLGLVLGVGLGSTVLGGAFARKIVRPVQALSDADHALARGDEKGAIVCESWLPANEIGELVRARNARIKELLERQRELAAEHKARIAAAEDLERITYSMVHDMRAPLRAIIMFGDMLADEAKERLNETERMYVARMRSACSRMDQLICDMLRYSSLLRQDLPLSVVDVPRLLREVVERHPPFQQHTEQITIDPDMPPVNGNEFVLAECFVALLDNAFRYGKPDTKPAVRITAKPFEDWIRITVEDNGAGMSRDFQARVFGIFERGSNAQGGSGIGLALVRVAVERMGGRVGVESREGDGSRFWMDLRRAA